MKKYIIPATLFLLLIFWASVGFSQVEVPDQVSTSAKVIGWISTILIGLLSVPLTNLAKKYPVVNGAVTIVANSVINLVLVVLLDKIFSIGIWNDATFMDYMIQTLGINQTVASLFFEIVKPTATT